MNFRKNPFYILKLGCDAGRHEINAAAEELAFFADSAEIERAQGELLNPARRLKAEMDWFHTGNQEQLRGAVEKGSMIEADWATDLTRLNIDCYNFPKKAVGSSRQIQEEILRLDRSFAEARTDDVCAALNADRVLASMPTVSENEVASQMLRKQAEAQQMISEVLQALPEKEYIFLMTDLAEHLLDHSLQGGVVGGIVDQYEVRMHDKLETVAGEIREEMGRVRSLSGKEVLTDAVNDMLYEVEYWDLLAQPIQLKCQANGLKHELSEKLGRELQQLAVLLHNEKHETGISALMVQRLKPIFAELPELSAQLESDDETLSNLMGQGVGQDTEQDTEQDPELSKLMQAVDDLQEALSQLQDLAKSLPSETRQQMQEDVWLLREQTVELNRTILNLENFDSESKKKLRLIVYGSVREAAVRLHNERAETEFAVELAKALKKNFSDIPEISDKVNSEWKMLKDQAENAYTVRRLKYNAFLPELPLKPSVKSKSQTESQDTKSSKKSETSSNGALIAIWDPSTEKTYETGSPVVIIGSSDQADLKIQGRGIEPVHAMIVLHQGRWRIYNEFSESGVWVNDEKIYRFGSSERTLKPGDTIRLGEQNGTLKVTECRSGGGTKRPKWKKICAIAAAVLLVFAAVLYGVISSSYKKNHQAGVEAYEQGNYALAADYFRNSGSSDRELANESAVRAGESFYRNGDYESALKYYQLAGKQAEDNVGLCRGWLASEEGDYETAIELFMVCEPSTERSRGLDEAYYQKGRELVEKGQELAEDEWFEEAQEQFEEALSVLSQISAPASRIRLEDWAHLLRGKMNFREGEYQAAKSDFAQCVSDEEGKTYAEILSGIDNGQCYLSAVRAYTTTWHFSGSFSDEEWLDAFEALIGTKDRSDLSRRLDEEAALLYLESHTDYNRNEEKLLDQLNSLYRLADDLGTENFTFDRYFIVPSIDEVVSACGADPQGKVLILQERHVFPNRESRYFVMLDQMKALPDEYYPHSLDEVEYVLLLTFDYQNDGNYIGAKTVGIRLSGNVKLFSMPSNRKLYDSGTIKGDSSPGTIWYSGEAPDYRDGGAPELNSQLEKALNMIFGT